METLIYMISAIFTVMIKDQIHRLLNLDYNVFTDSFNLLLVLVDVVIFIVIFYLVLNSIRFFVTKFRK